MFRGYLEDAQHTRNILLINRCFNSLQYINPTVSTYISTSSQSTISIQGKTSCSSEILFAKELLFSAKMFLCTLNFTENPRFLCKIKLQITFYRFSKFNGHLPCHIFHLQPRCTLSNGRQTR